MSQQAMDLRRSVHLVRRHRFLVGGVVTLGLVLGGGYAVLRPPMITSTAEVLLSQSSQAAQAGAAAAASGSQDPYTATQLVIAKSTPVLVGALPDARPIMSVSQLSRDVQAGSLTPYVISISVQAKTAADATATANAVADSYIRYLGSGSSPGGTVAAQLLEPATAAAGTGLIKHVVIYALAGAIFGLLIGSIIAIAIGRSDRRLRERDEIANSIGVPVLASFPVDHPADAGGWTKLLEDYKPAALHTLQLRRALQQLGITSADASASSRSFTVLSLSSDPGAIALGPQLAIFAASQGIPTALVVGPQQDAAVTATLRTACAAPSATSKRPGPLRVFVTDSSEGGQSDAVLTVVVAVVDSRSPQIPDTSHATGALLGVSAGAATADELARVAVSAASSGREISGILVADPDSADVTTGLLPQLGRRGQHRMPTRMTGIATEIRR